MNISRVERTRKMRAVSGVLGSSIMFAVLFTVGISYFLYINQGAYLSMQAGQQRIQAANQAADEQLSIQVGVTSESDPWGQTGDISIRIANTGAVPVTVIDVFVTNPVLDKIVSKSQVVNGSQYLAVKGTPAQKGDLNITLPMVILPGISTSLMSGCGAKPGCDIAVSKAAYAYVSGTPVVVSVLTNNGNIFSSEYPFRPSVVTATSTSTTTTVSTSRLPGGNPGGNVLVVEMVATPPQTYVCSHCVNDTVTVFNYGPAPVYSVKLNPSVPIIETTGSVAINSVGACVLKGGNSTLRGFPGNGTVPSIVFVCTYSANPIGYGGFASFAGTAIGTYLGLPIVSGQAISNTIQIGGPINVLNQGPYSVNFFYFKYSACTNAPSGSWTYAPHCNTTPSPVKFNSLPAASGVDANNSYYVAFYVQVINSYNTTIPILPYTYMLTDPTIGGETPIYLVGNGTTPYVPNYNPGGTGIPELTPYPSACLPSNPVGCINVPPGGEVTLTFAACDIGSTWWAWGGTAWGTSYDPGNNCSPDPPNYCASINGSPSGCTVKRESTYVDVVITFEYNNQVYTQNIPFVGQVVS